MKRRFASTLRQKNVSDFPIIPFEDLDGTIYEIKNRIGLAEIDVDTKVQSNFTDNLRETYYLGITLEIVCEDPLNDSVIEDPYNQLNQLGPLIIKYSKDMVERFDSTNSDLLSYIHEKRSDLENQKLLMRNHLDSAKIFFKYFVASLKKSRISFERRKIKSTEEKNSYDNVLLLPCSFTILFSLLSIVTNIIWGKYIPRILSIILCAIFYILSIQVVAVSTYLTYNIPQDIFTQEPDYFKLFNFEMSSYDKKSIINSQKVLLACDHKNSNLFYSHEKGIFIKIESLVRDLHDELLEKIYDNFGLITHPTQKEILEMNALVNLMIEEVSKLKSCDTMQQETRIGLDFLNETKNYLELCLKLATNIENLTYFTSAVVQEKMKNINRTIYEPIFKINQSFIEADFKCQPFYNTLLNAFISSHQPDKNGYRDMFKITVMGCSTLCLILYLLAFGRRIKLTCDSGPPKEYKDSNKKSRKAKKNVALRSPKRI